MNPEIELLVERPKRLMVITAHPDDAEFGVAGTVAHWVAQGTVAQLVCITSGDAGSDDATTDPLELATLRETEQRTAAAIVGYEEVTFLHRPDGAVANDLALREQLVRIIRAFRPETVVTSDPRVLIHERGFVNHVDHREAGAAAIDAVYPAAENAMAFPHLVTSEGLEPHYVRQLCLFWTDRPTAAVDIGDTLAVKLRALHAHASQHRQPEQLDVHITDWAHHEGAKAGLEAAELFAVIRLR